jgi:hypothetical protein
MFALTDHADAATMREHPVRPDPMRRMGRGLKTLHARLLCTAFSTLVLAAAPYGAHAADVPPVWATMQSFRGRITYVAHNTQDDRHPISGTFTEDDEGWRLEETEDGVLRVHLSGDRSWVRSAGQTLYVDDPVAPDELVNSWLAVVGEAARTHLTAGLQAGEWVADAGFRIFFVPAGDAAAGIADDESSTGLSFAYAGWRTLTGLPLPTSIVRMVGGAPIASFLIDHYEVQPAMPAARPAPAPATGVGNGASRATTTTTVWPAAGAAARRGLAWLALFLTAGFLLLLWLRRDLWIERLCGFVAEDPRGWRDVGMTAFVSPEGLLVFDGRTYRVGAAFFNRRVLVQRSAAFLRITHPDVPRPAIVARLFPTRAIRAGRSSLAGFTLIESVIATALFALVVVGALLPALVAAANADRVAARHENAVRVAHNVLVDEEAALAYGTHILPEKLSTSIEGYAVEVDVTPAFTADLFQVQVRVADAAGTSLAWAVTMVGPPVTPPQPTSGSPPP